MIQTISVGIAGPIPRDKTLAAKGNRKFLRKRKIKRNGSRVVVSVRSGQGRFLHPQIHKV